MWSQQVQQGALPTRNPLLFPLHNTKNAPCALQLFRFEAQIRKYNRGRLRAALIDEIPPNALRRKRDPDWRGGFSVGVDLGMSRTGVALSKGFTVRPLTVIISKFHA